jgi:hypothetical protein
MLRTELASQTLDSSHHQRVRKQYGFTYAIDPEWLTCIELGGIRMRTREHRK